jgi:hypothetical protein
MDYPAPLVTLNDGDLDLAEAYDSGIGRWDKLAIMYGYGSGESEAGYLDSVLQLAQEEELRFISDPDSRTINNAHAASHLWDNGADPLQEFERMTRLRAHALESFSTAANRPDTPRSALEETLVPVYYGHRYQAEAVGKLIGGLDYDYLQNDAAQASYSMVPAERQEQAIDALLGSLEPGFLRLPETVLNLLPPKAYGYARTRESFPAYTGVTFDAIAAAEAAAGHTLDILLNPERAARLQQQAARSDQQPGFASVLGQLTEKALQSGEYSGMEAAIHQRVNHVYVHKLMALSGNTQAPESVRASASMELTRLLQGIGGMKLFGDDPENYNAHYYYQAQRIAAFNEGKFELEEEKLKAMPPGSPI